jgi:hypothetical protein
LFLGVTVAQKTVNLFDMVQIHEEQLFDIFVDLFTIYRIVKSILRAAMFSNKKG